MDVESRPRLSFPDSRSFLCGLLAAGLTLSGAAGCSDSASRDEAKPGGCVTDFREGTDYFPHKVTLAEATGFSVEYHYDTIAADYRAAKTKAHSAATKPTIITGKQYKGTWSVAGGQSYVAAYLREAGGSYVFAGLPGTGTNSVDVETVLAKGATAEFWLNPEMTRGWANAGDVTQADARYGALTALRKGNVWSPVKRVNAVGGNDYWESGVIHPDRVLEDLVAILHPELMPGHEFVYYTKLGS